MKQILSSEKFLNASPIMTTFLLEGASVNQIIRMWTEHSSKDQSLLAWVMVNLALLIWLNWFIRVTPEKKLPIYTTSFAWCLNVVVILTVVKFRF